MSFERACALSELTDSEPLAVKVADTDVAAAAAAWASVGDDADGLCGTFTDETGPELVERMYPPPTLDRLREVKKQWDPGNLFRRNHNILPA